MNDMDEWEQPKSNHGQWTPVRVGNANSTQAENLLGISRTFVSNSESISDLWSRKRTRSDESGAMRIFYLDLAISTK